MNDKYTEPSARTPKHAAEPYEPKHAAEPRELMTLPIRRALYIVGVLLGVAGIVYGGMNVDSELGAALLTASAFILAQAGVALTHPTKK